MAPPAAEPTFKMATDEWLRYVEHDRRRRPSTVLDYKREIRRNLLPAFGADTPLRSITTADIDAYRAPTRRRAAPAADDQQAARAAPRDLQARSARLRTAGEPGGDGRAAAISALG